MDVDLTTLKKTDKKKGPDQKWTKEQEQLLASWSERAAGYRWLHSRSEKLYRCRNYTFTIPVIILSTLTGTANFAMDSFVPESHKQMAMACVGGVNIFAGILSTLQNFLRYAELMESHRVCEVSWSKLSRDIAVELTLEPKMRKPAFDFLNVCRAEYDRLIEQSPPIDDDIIKKYKGEFKGLQQDFNHPLICNGLHKCRIFEKNEEEQKAQTIAAAGDKFLNLKKKHWEPAFDNQLTRKVKVSSQIQNEESKQELQSLTGLNKVSKFKKNTDTDKESNDKHPLEQINDIIKQNSDKNESSEKVDIETGKIETAIENKELKTEELKTEELKTEELKHEELKPEELKTEELKPEELKTEELKPEIVKEDDIVFGQSIDENIQDETEEELQSNFINSISEK